MDIQKLIQDAIEERFKDAGPSMKFVMTEMATYWATFALSLDRWVKVEDGLPVENSSVLFSNGNYVHYGYRQGNKFHTHNCPYIIGEHITHWQPLPSPPSQ